MKKTKKHTCTNKMGVTTTHSIAKLHLTWLQTRLTVINKIDPSQGVKINAFN